MSEAKQTDDVEKSTAVAGQNERMVMPETGAMWEAYGPSRINLTFDYESSVGPTEINDVTGPLCIVSGDTPEDSLANAQRIADLLNSFGIEA